MEENKKAQPISKKDFDKLKGDLKSYADDWVNEVIKKINLNHAGTEYENASIAKIYKTFRCLTVSGSWRFIVYSSGKSVLKDLQEKVEQVKSI